MELSPPPHARCSLAKDTARRSPGRASRAADHADRSCWAGTPHGRRLVFPGPHPGDCPLSPYPLRQNGSRGSWRPAASRTGVDGASLWANPNPLSGLQRLRAHGRLQGQPAPPTKHGNQGPERTMGRSRGAGPSVAGRGEKGAISIIYAALPEYQPSYREPFMEHFLNTSPQTENRLWSTS